MFNQLIHAINTKTKPLSAEAERALVERYVAGDADAGQELIEAHLKVGLILSLEYVKRGGALEDLFQESYLGLQAALERFDPTKGTRFGSYATWWVRSRLQDYQRSKDRQIDLPSHVVDQLSRLSRTSEQFSLENEREPTTGELSELMELSEEKVLRLKSHMQGSVSLDASVENSDGGTAKVADIVEDVNQECASYYAERLDDLAMVKDMIMRRLNQQERDIICLRFGLCGCVETTLVDTGKLLEISTARVQQLERQAIKKLQQAMISA